MRLINDLFKGIILLGLIGLGADLFDLKILAAKAASVHSKKVMSYRSWNDQLFRKP